MPEHWNPVLGNYEESVGWIDPLGVRIIIAVIVGVMSNFLRNLVLSVNDEEGLISAATQEPECQVFARSCPGEFHELKFNLRALGIVRRCLDENSSYIRGREEFWCHDGLKNPPKNVM